MLVEYHVNATKYEISTPLPNYFLLVNVSIFESNSYDKPAIHIQQEFAWKQ
jgi:hypothetical protein